MSHNCAVPGCLDVISNAMLMCRPHWLRVPEPEAHEVYVSNRLRSGMQGRPMPEVVAAQRRYLTAVDAARQAVLQAEAEGR